METAHDLSLNNSPEIKRKRIANYWLLVYIARKIERCWILKQHSKKKQRSELTDYAFYLLRPLAWTSINGICCTTNISSAISLSAAPVPGVYPLFPARIWVQYAMWGWSHYWSARPIWTNCPLPSSSRRTYWSCWITRQPKYLGKKKNKLLPIGQAIMKLLSYFYLKGEHLLLPDLMKSPALFAKKTRKTDQQR